MSLAKQANASAQTKRRRVQIDEVNVAQNVVTGKDQHGLTFQITYGPWFDHGIISVPKQGENWIIEQYRQEWRLKFKVEDLANITNSLQPGDKYLNAGTIWINGNVNLTSGSLTINDPVNPTDAATKNYVDTHLGAGAVTSVFGRSGVITAQTGDYTVSQITGAAPLASPALTGTPTAPTALAGTNTTQIATTAFVQTAVAVTSVFGRTGTVVATTGDYTAAQVTNAADLSKTTFQQFSGPIITKMIGDTGTLGTVATGTLAITSSVVRISTTDGTTVTTITGHIGSTFLYLRNSTASTIPFAAGGGAPDGIVQGFSLPSNGYVLVVYDATQSVWVPVAMSSNTQLGLGPGLLSVTTILTGTTSYTAPAATTSLNMEGWGGGGGSGGCAASGATTNLAVSQAGGPASYSRKRITTNIGTHVVAVGAGGTAGAAGSNSGSIGGATTFQDTTSATVLSTLGGTGGVGSSGTGGIAGGTSILYIHGVGTSAGTQTGDTTITPGRGQTIFRQSGSLGGAFGDSSAPRGGTSTGWVIAAASSGTAGSGGSFPGGGASPAIDTNNTARAGAAGGNGLLRVEAYG